MLISPRCDEAVMVRRLEHQGCIWCLFTFADTQAYWTSEQEVKNYEGPIPDLEPEPSYLLAQIHELKSEHENKISSMLDKKEADEGTILILQEKLKTA